MSYQERIYNQNGNLNRNFAGTTPTTSSDICVFNRPSFIMSGATKIDCPEVTCNINNIPYNDLFTGTTNCFIESALSGSCFNGINWVTNIYEDDILTYNNVFYTSTSLTGTVIDVTIFSGSVVTAFDTLGYDYSFDGTGFTITKPSIIENIKIELKTELDYDTTCFVTGNTTGDTSCSCPAGYTATTALDGCQLFTYTAATYNGSGTTAVACDALSDHSLQGTYWWPSIENVTLPLVRNNSDGYNTLREGNIGGPAFTSVTFVTSAFWGQNPNPGGIYGRLNASGVKRSSGPLSEWVGFSVCIDIPTTKTYYIGIGANNAVRFTLDGELIINLDDVTNTDNLKVWHMIPVTMTSGKHIIEIEGRNDDDFNATAFGAEIYSETLENLTGATTTGDTGLIFSTFDRIGGEFDLGTTIGYTCPSGYSLDTCNIPYTCIQISNTDIECLFTGNCSTNEVVCDLDFSGLTLSDTNVHILTGQTEINLTFNFTGNTSSFIDSNAKFKYEVYKYIPQLTLFNKPAIYSSDYIDWSEFSGTSAVTTSILVNSLNPDGQYLVKGHFIHDICTEFATRLGYTYSTTSNISGESYGLYEPSRDNYFILFTEADEPILQNGIDDSVIGSLVVVSTLIEESTNQFTLPFTNGDFIIALNGLVLANELDYTINSVELDSGVVNNLTLSGITVSGDILTYAYTNSDNTNNIKAENFDITTAITSGTTNNEGLNTVYYNTDTNKYEIFLSMTPVDGNDMVVTLNGITLANNIDYYQSISNPKRIIFNGDIIVSDIITVYYNTNTNIQGDQFGTSLLVNWVINNAPQNTDGYFTVEVASDKNFNNIISSGTTDYILGATGYGLSINLIGELGDKQYYRVKNTKKFITLCSETLISEKYSEIVAITIQTNLNNSY